jgi:hypothetical protein
LFAKVSRERERESGEVRESQQERGTQGESGRKFNKEISQFFKKIIMMMYKIVKS